MTSGKAEPLANPMASMLNVNAERPLPLLDPAI